MITIEPYLPLALATCHSGSQVICTPPVMDTDDDWLFLMHPEGAEGLEEQFRQDGWLLGGYDPRKWRFCHLREDPIELRDPEDKEKVFHSWTKDHLNIILTCSNDYFANFSLATEVAKRLNLLKKSDRVLLFNAFTYGEIVEWNPKLNYNQVMNNPKNVNQVLEDIAMARPIQLNQPAANVQVQIQANADPF